MFDEPYCEIPLRARDKTLRGVALVSSGDYEWLDQWRWCIGGKGYVVRGVRDGRRIVAFRMNRVVLGLEHGDPRQGDHINLNKLDNRRSNLRIVTNAENCQNKSVRTNTASRYRGVTWHKGMAAWAAQGFVAGRTYHIGYFSDEDEAGAAAETWRSEHMPFSTT